VNFLANIFIVLFILGWLAVMVWLGVSIFDDDKEDWQRWAAGVGLILMFTVPLAIAMTASEDEPLCARGHEEYHLIGKTMQRVWVCDQYQVEAK
jgi:hypothetical protein